VFDLVSPGLIGKWVRIVELFLCSTVARKAQQQHLHLYALKGALLPERVA